MTDRDAALRALKLLDLTDLSDEASDAGLQALCARAVAPPGPVAAICIWPRFIAAARATLGKTEVKIATVVNFPAGDSDPGPVLAQTSAALVAGADEIDLVLPWRSFLAGDIAAARSMVAEVKEACGPHALKVILETGEYPDQDAVLAASRLAIEAGADFIKTSTGKTARSASLDAARTMLEAIKASGRAVGLKPSGGIRTLAEANAYLALADEVMGPGWATPATFRFGASGLHQVLVEVLAGVEPAAASGPY